MSSTQIDSLNIRIESTARDATAAIDALIQSFQKLKTAGNFKEIEKSLDKISKATNKGLKDVPKTFAKASKAADKLANSTKKVATNASGMGSALGGAVTGLLQFVGNALGINSVGDALIQSAQAAMEWEGISARFGEGFGEQADEAYAHVMKLQNALQINDQQFMQYASNFATLGKGMGVPTRAIKDMSIGMTELAYDIYAKNNDFYSLEEALLAVRSAFLGEIEPIRKAGISITEATLKEAAANYGLTMSVEKMTEAQKMQLRYKVMLDQAYASSTVGTYISEINTAEGAYRALGQQIKGLAQTIGGLLLPVVSAVLPYLQALVSLVTMAVRALASFFGISIKSPSWGGGMKELATSAGGASKAVDDTTDSLGGAAKAAKKLKDYTMGFDELNVIKPQQDTPKGGGGSGGGVGGGGDLGLDFGNLWTDEMINNADLKAKEIAQNIINALLPIKNAIMAIDFKPLMSSLSRLWEALKPFAATIGAGLYWFLLNVLIPLAGYTIENIIPAFLNALAAVLEWVTPQLQQFGNWIVANKDSILTVATYVTAFFLAFQAASWIMGAVSAIGTVSTAVGGLTAFLGKLLIHGQSLAIIFGASGGGVTGVFAVLGSILSSVISAVFSPLSLIAIAIASTAMVLAENWDKVVQVFKSFIDNIDLAGKFEAIKTALAPLMEKLAGLKDLFTAIGVIGAGVLAVAMSIVAGIFNGFISMLPGLITAVGGLVDILAAVGTIALSVIQFFGSMVAVIKALIEGDFSGAATLFSDAWSTMWTNVSTALSQIWQGVVDTFGGLWEAAGGLLIGFVDGVISWFLSLSGVTLKTISSFVTRAIAFFGSLWSSIKQMWAGVSDWFGTLFTNAWTSITGAWSGVKTWFSNVWASIKTTFSVVNTWFKTKFDSAWTSIKNTWSGVKTWFSNVWTGIKGVFSSVGTWFQTTFSDAWTKIKNVFSGWGTFFGNLWTTVKSKFTDFGVKISAALSSSIVTAINAIISKIENAINSAIRKINGIIEAINTVPGIEIKLISEISIPRLASGGFVDEGQLFIAREAGAEMVGSMNNRTTVANNDQIVEGISAGVYSAVVAAMSQSSGNNQASFNIYIDGRQVMAAVEKRQRERGANIMTGGVTLGY